MRLHSVITRPAFTRDPFALMTRDLNRLFDETLGGLAATSACAGTGLKLDVSETDTAVTVRAEAPGVDEKDMEISYDEGVLTIAGEKKLERDDKTETLHLTERAYGSFSRSIAVPAAIEADKIEAKFAKGVLTVILPKQAKAVAKAKRIEVKTA